MDRKIQIIALIIFGFVAGISIYLLRHNTESPQSYSVSTPSGLAFGPGPTYYKVQQQPPPGVCHYREAEDGQILPDSDCTPGAINPRVTQDNLNETICKPGYTKSIRPTQSITQAEKRANALAYSYAGSFSDAEYDHLVSLELGGDPNDPRNLWIEPGGIPNEKDKVESKLHVLVCSGKVTLSAAQEAIAEDWTTALDVVQP